CLNLNLGYVRWNCTVFFSFVAAFILLWIMPWFWLGFSLLLIAYVGPLSWYVVMRNSKVEQHQKVLTREHMRHFISRKASKIGVKVDAERRDPRDEGPPVELTPRGGKTEQDDAANLLQCRQSPGFVALKELLADAIERRADKILLDFTPQAVAVRYQIDGVWHDRGPKDRAEADVLLAVMKTLSALDPRERSKRQAGQFGAEQAGTKYDCDLTSQGVKTGERVMLSLDDGSPPPNSPAALGMRAKLFEQFKEVLATKSGMVVFSSLPDGGLTTTVDAMLKECDRYLRSFVAVEEKSHRERAIENIEVTTYDAASDETPVSVLPKLLRTYPDALVVRDSSDQATLKLLCEQTNEERFVVTTLRAKEAAEVLLRLLLVKVPADELAPAVLAVLNQRLIRKLCDGCKEAYQPNPEVLKQIGIPPDRVAQLYRVPAEREEVCTECGGLGFRGRTSIYELLVVNDAVRQALVESPKIDVLRKVAIKSGMKTLQQEGVVLVAKGVTSIKELLRVLKQ
ncbi:MAG: Flp pilus assembly complex ATPase component TadA, partial [Planctomycetes bacterium]|nr:Flp pilus assembly complex ATPase component TadA [Planctomycetota bacterium]